MHNIDIPYFNTYAVLPALTLPKPNRNRCRPHGHLDRDAVHKDRKLNEYDSEGQYERRFVPCESHT